MRRNAAELDHRIQRDLLFRELTNGDGGAVNRQRRNDDVDAASIQQTRVAKGRAFIDAATNRCHDARCDRKHVGIVAELDVCQRQLALAFAVDLLGPVDHDFRDAFIGQQRLKRAKAKHVVKKLFDQINALCGVQLCFCFQQKIADEAFKVTRKVFTPHAGSGRGIDALKHQRLDFKLGLIYADAACACDGRLDVARRGRRRFRLWLRFGRGFLRHETFALFGLRCGRWGVLLDRLTQQTVGQSRDKIALVEEVKLHPLFAQKGSGDGFNLAR